MAFHRAVNIYSPASVWGRWREGDHFNGTQWFSIRAAATGSHVKHRN